MEEPVWEESEPPEGTEVYPVAGIVGRSGDDIVVTIELPEELGAEMAGPTGIRIRKDAPTQAERNTWEVYDALLRKEEDDDE